jgi:hypothetical protein
MRLTKRPPDLHDGRVADELTTKILVDIRERIDRLDTGLHGEIRALRSEVKAEIADTNRNVAILAKIIESVHTQLEKVLQWQKESAWLPRRVDALEVASADHEERIERIEGGDPGVDIDR